MRAKLLWCAALSALLAACAQPGIQLQADWPEASQIGDFTADGRLAVKVEEKGSYANFDWSYQNQVQTIDVNTPLGTTVGQLCQDNKGVMATDSKGNIYRAQTPEELSRQLLGYELPIQYLHIWASGKRVASAPYQILSDGRLQQFDWVISRQTDQEGKSRILLLEGNKLSIRLVFDQINHHPEKSGQTQCAMRQ